MKKNILYWTLALTVLSCTKQEGVPGPAGTPGSAGANGKGASTDTASITGQLALYDEFSVNQSNASGVVITLSSGSQQVKDTSDATGKYSFAGVVTGTYDLTFQKTGYGTMKVFGLSLFGGGKVSTLVPYIQMVQVPVKTAPDAFSLISNNSNTASFNIRLDTSSLTYQQFDENFIIYISRNRTVGPTDYSIVLQTYLNAIYPDGAGGYTLNFNKTTSPTLANGITPGTTLYVVVYTYNTYLRALDYPQDQVFSGPASNYIDPQTGKIVYPNLSKPSPVVQFTF